MTEIKCGKLTKIDLVMKKYVLDVAPGVQYTLMGNDEKLSLYDDGGVRGYILIDYTSGSGSIWVEKNGIEDEDIGEYEIVDGKYRILPYEHFMVNGPWKEDLHPLDYLVQKLSEIEIK